MDKQQKSMRTKNNKNFPSNHIKNSIFNLPLQYFHIFINSTTHGRTQKITADPLYYYVQGHSQYNSIKSFLNSIKYYSSGTRNPNNDSFNTSYNKWDLIKDFCKPKIAGGWKRHLTSYGKRRAIKTSKNTLLEYDTHSFYTNNTVDNNSFKNLSKYMSNEGRKHKVEKKCCVESTIRPNSSNERYAFSNAIVNGTKMNTSTGITLTRQFKKQLIISMIKEHRVSNDILISLKEAVKNVKDENKRLERIAEIILHKFNINIQMTDKGLIREEKNPLLIKTVERFSPIGTKANTQQRRIHINRENNMQKLLVGVKKDKINETIALINRYASLTFRNKTNYYDMKLIHELHYKLGLGKRYQCEEEIKTRITQIKEKLLRLLYNVINKENEVVLKNVGIPKYCIKNGNNSALVKSLFRERWWWTSSDDSTCNLLWTQWRDKKYIESLGTVEVPINSVLPRISNHLEGNYYLGHKKNMHKCLTLYYSLLDKDITDITPLTFHIKKGKLNKEFETVYYQCKEEAKKSQRKNWWILKPGENSNRGNGITVTKSLSNIVNYVKEAINTCIIQKYIERPLLFEKRKFDIRCFALVTSINGYIKAYYYQDGYLRTSSKDYSLDNQSKSIHLTNEAVQIKYEDFGKYEAGNKISYGEFQKYLEGKGKLKQKLDFYKDILPKIKVYWLLIVEYNNKDYKIRLCFY